MNDAVSHAPARTSAAISLFAALLAVSTAGLYSAVSLLLGGLAILLLTAGLVRASLRAVTAGAVALFFGIVASGLEGAPPMLLLFAGAATVVTWDVGENAIGIGEQLGREATTFRIEITHALGSLGVGAVAAGVGYGLFLVGQGGRPITAVLFLVLGAVILISALRVVDSRQSTHRTR